MEDKYQIQRKDLLFVIIAVIITLAILAISIIYRGYLVNADIIRHFSLFGVWFITLIAASPVSITGVPIPYVIVIITVTGILAPNWQLLAPFAVGLIAAIGAMLGELITFSIGYNSQSLTKRLIVRINRSIYNRAERWVNKYGILAIFITSAIPNPLHLPITLIIGSLRFSPVKWVLLTLAGNAIKCLSFALIGYFSINLIIHFFGM